MVEEETMQEEKAQEEKMQDAQREKIEETKAPEVKKANLLQRFYRFDIYITMIIVLSVLAAINMLNFGIMNTLPQLAVAVVVATLVEALWDRFKMKKWQYSKSAIITGIFIGSLLDPGQILYVPAAAALVAILSKQLIRAKYRHFFNPTLFSLLIVTIIFKTSIGWWSSANMLATLALGLFISVKYRRLGLTLPFLLTYFLISVLLNPAVITMSGLTTSLLNMLNDTALMFFVFFMLVEPKTSPFSARGRMIYGPVVAVLFFAMGMLLPMLLSSTGLLLDQTAVTIAIGNVIAWIMNWKMI